MAKLNIPRMTKSAEECLGWPYVSPGSNDYRGIDCSGLFVKIYKDQGASIYHGSNTIYRKYCGDKGKLTSAGQLCEGMAVFKWNPNTPEKFDDGLGDFQHIGYVAGVNPLRIIHASTGTMCVTTDTKIGKWAYWGKLKDVDYENGGEDTEPDEGGDEGMKGNVWSENGNPVNMRTGPATSNKIVGKIPCGNEITILKTLSKGGVDWVYGTAEDEEGRERTGYMMAEFVSTDGDIPDEPDGGPDDPTGDITLTLTAAEACSLLPMLDKLVEAIIDQVGRG